ncbi:hypothetical protein H5410_046026, partial [Solanum commersonii]
MKKLKGDELDQRADHRLARERGFKTKTTKLIASGYWVIVGSARRVNPRPFLTHSARESEWPTVKVVLNCSNSVFQRNRVDSGSRENLSLLKSILITNVQQFTINNIYPI